MTAISRPAAMATVKRRRGPQPGRLLLHISIGILIFLWLLPTLGMLVNSFREPADVSSSGWWTALTPTAKLTLENYQHVLAQNGLGQAFLNSLFITIPATIIPVAVGAFAAEPFAWF
jgi:alpha-glucoside transport system permease protein